MKLLAIALGTCAATLAGGLFALRFRDRLHLILGFSAGAVIAVAFFDLLPEALELAGPTRGNAAVTAWVALGFMVYMVLDRMTMRRKGAPLATSDRVLRGRVGAGSLAFHSILDGVGIGLGFQVSPAVGLIIAVAVLAHDFSDGINTVSLVLKNSGTRRQAFRWLVADAVAPLIGVASTLAWQPPSADLGLALAIFCGFFLYIGASDLLPEAYHAHPTTLSTAMTVLGAALIYGAIHWAA